MIIGVISDTHIPERTDTLPKQIFNVFEDADLIIHAGDITSLDVLDKLSEIAEVKAVCGNMDSQRTCEKLPKKEVLKIGNFSIGIIHGSGHPSYLLDFVKGEFDRNIDVIIFGHSHRPFNEKRGKTLFFNPGSPTDTFFSPYSSCGILKINNDIHAEIIKLDNE